MLKLALVGKNISHSQSENIYRQIIKQNFEYQLLDYSDPIQIPSAQFLLEHFCGVSITSPYKKHFLNEVFLDEETRSLKAINCLYKKDKLICGVNTDYQALKDLIDLFPLDKVALLGDGAMSFLCQKLLNEKQKKYEVFCRKKNGDISELNLQGYSLVINCCSREFHFAGKISAQTYFWDLNYNVKHSSQIRLYQDGLSLLKLQAQKALNYWQIF